MSTTVLKTVCDELKACNVITSNREFCVSWLAKDASYMRVLRHHKAQPSADASLAIMRIISARVKNQNTQTWFNVLENCAAFARRQWISKPRSSG
jgi:hypothetical protein